MPRLHIDRLRKRKSNAAVRGGIVTPGGEYIYSVYKYIRRTGYTMIRNSTGAGLDEAAVAASRAAHGDNSLPAAGRHGFLRKFVSNLGDPVIKVLLCALAVNIVFMFRDADWFETAGIAVSVFAATLISTLSEYGSEAAYARLRDTGQNPVCRVRRSGGVTQIPVNDVVVGDIVLLSAGDEIPADGLIISGTPGLDMAAMTGESREVIKRPGRDTSLLPSSPSAALRGCFVMSGDAEMRVTAVGGETYLGGISREVQTETRDSPLKVRLSKLASQISRLGYIAAVAVAAAYLFNTLVLDSGGVPAVIMLKLTDLPYMLSRLLDAFTLGLTVIVVAVPEGLPMMIAVVLSSNVRRMVRAGVLVKKPVGIEAAGSMNVLFTDKTGTLTCGAMTVSGILTGDGRYPTPAALARVNPQAHRLYCLSSYYNTGSSVGSCVAGVAGGVDSAGGRGGANSNVPCAVGGNATDRALLNSVLDITPPPARAGRRVPFDSAKKYSAAALETSDGSFCLYKGAPELLLPRVTRCVAPDGSERRADRYEISRRISAACSGGSRVILIARHAAAAPHADGIPPELTFVCAVLLRDPPRPAAAASVATLRGAGIHVVMVTGDSRETASAIAGECGMLGGGVDTVLDSSELAALTDARLSGMLPRIGVICRALPSDKSRLVRVAQAAGMVCGMTGDGINDAPALRAADVGFSMGAGTGVARDAGDIVILDNDLKSIANAVLYGRNVFKSIRKFIVLQLTMNFCAVGVSMIGPFIGIDAPVTVVQMLWINIIMDTLGGLAFAGEAALPSCMKERPKRRDEPIMNRYMVNQILFLGGFTVAMSIIFLKNPAVISLFRASPGGICHLTAFFAFFIFAGVFNCFNSRSDRLRMLSGISRNPAFITIMAAVLAIQIAFVYLGGAVLRTVPLTAAELLWTMLLSLSVFPVELLRRLLWRLRGRHDGF